METFFLFVKADILAGQDVATCHIAEGLGSCYFGIPGLLVPYNVL
jgi:hypothetical protein